MTANAERVLVTGARDGDSDLTITGQTDKRPSRQVFGSGSRGQGHVRRFPMEPSHLSVVVDLSPCQWYQSSLPLDNFLAQLLVFLNAHIALEHDNSLAVFAALPNKRLAVR